MEESSSEQSADLSDEELQHALLSGKLKPGLNHVVEKVQKVFINKEDKLKEKYDEIKLDLNWLERLDITCDLKKGNKQKWKISPILIKTTSKGNDVLPTIKMAVVQALSKLKKLGISTERPSDYFAEMVKTDDHMQKVREKLITKELVMEKSEKARKMREMKKYGKKVQQEVLRKRQQEKKQMLDSVKKYRKGQKGKPEFLTNDNDEFEVNTEKGAKRSAGNTVQGKSAKRQRKDVKYGFGGKKRANKRNTSESVDDIRSFSSAKHNKSPRAKTKTKAKRLGKSRRQKIKGKAR
ncbi:LOW QUALITY PROTEIN: probable rRNA-processing protein EBP2 [Xenia sp. Carnegie-2017]|uniref:LOW QUALITY PROTEIN: probable rRNA-processing protein EBP2 n=1 Tax=Xenia sp. Carnegie-2017 TaxID=2897299 RepID=UPI001F03CC2E|nr:LOW QUALITY PROTEIN: probable rRNA-processing protein EBP2 [Xenia sp. Carnegie-2017]